MANGGSTFADIPVGIGGLANGASSNPCAGLDVFLVVAVLVLVVLNTCFDRTAQDANGKSSASGSGEVNRSILTFSCDVVLLMHVLLLTGFAGFEA